jgi:hypothetical protein
MPSSSRLGTAPTITRRLPVVLTRGQGAHLWDTAGRLRRHDERLFGGEPRPRPPAHPGHSGTLIRASEVGASHADET